MVKDFNKKPDFDEHMKQYNRGLPSDEKKKILNKGVILRQANIPFEAWEEVYNAGMKAGMEGAKLSRGGKLPDYATGRFKQSDINPKGGTTGEIMNAPKEKQLDFLDRLKVQNRDNTIAPSPTQLIPGVKTIDTRTDQRKIRDHDKMFGSDLAHNVQDHSADYYDDEGRPTKYSPYNLGTPGGTLREVPWKKEQYYNKDKQERMDLHQHRYHQDQA